MKNKIIVFLNLLTFFLCLNIDASEINIKSSKIKIDSTNNITYFEGKVTAVDSFNNRFFSEFASYDKEKDLYFTKGKTKITTSNNYEVITSNLVWNKKNNIFFSDSNTEILDKDKNRIFVDKFKYSNDSNIFYSKGKIKILDVNLNNYNFSEIYINTKEKKIIGSDIKAYLNKDSGPYNNENEPKIFANTMLYSNEKNILEKGILTYCKDRGDDKCPPWTLQSKKIEHNLAKKTIYYDNVTLKIYDFPIFFFPKFSHPDPTVKRRSGFLAPSLSNSSNLGSGFKIPYFWNISNDKDLTITPKFYLRENPLILAEYRQDFANSFLHLDTSYTKGYEKDNGGRTHFFSKFNYSILNNEKEVSELEVNFQKVSNDTYIKIQDINSGLVDSYTDILLNNFNYYYQKNDLFINLAPTIYEDTRKAGNLRYEYLLPLSIEKNLITDQKIGFLDLSSDLRLRNYETNKQSNFFVNNFNWKSERKISLLKTDSHFEGTLKTINYESNNLTEFKNDKFNTEVKSAIGYFSKLNLFKQNAEKSLFETLTPRLLFRYSPGNMRKVNEGRLSYSNLFTLNKINNFDTFENGLSASLGIEYKKNKTNFDTLENKEIFSFSIGQVINEKENKKMPSSSSLDKRFSDIVGTSNYNFNDSLSFNYNFSIDQNYKEINYNEIGFDYKLDKVKFNLNYLQEKNHIGNQEFLASNMQFNINDNSEINLSTKRNLLTSSAEYYNLSYNYLNDCLKAGIAYRREFYYDRDIKPNNSIMFTISLPFGDINSPNLSK